MLCCNTIRNQNVGPQFGARMLRSCAEPTYPELIPQAIPEPLMATLAMWNKESNTSTSECECGIWDKMDQRFLYASILTGVSLQVASSPQAILYTSKREPRGLSHQATARCGCASVASVLNFANGSLLRQHFTPMQR